MRFYSESFSISENEFLILRNLIHERTGIFFENDKKESMADKLSPFLIEKGFNSFLDYYYLLRYDSASEEEWNRLVDIITVPETFFWREADQINALVKILMPQFQNLQKNKPVKIMSIPCSSGEEPLTIAMALHEGGWYEKASIEIYAADISPKAIKKARTGVYRDFSFRNTSSYIREKYFTREKDGWHINPSMLPKVKFEVINLFDESYYDRIGRLNIIFCRNVFIYFSNDSIRRALKIFHRKLVMPGYLCVGSSESLFKITNDFEFQDIGGALIYEKR